jgi:hypothetical protein
MLTAKMKTILISSVLVFVFGCQDPRKAVQSWVGCNINDLMASQGAPHQVFDNGSSGKIYVWRNSGSVTMPGTATTTYGYGHAQTMYNPGQTFEFSATATFWVDSQGTITRASYVNR